MSEPLKITFGYPNQNCEMRWRSLSYSEGSNHLWLQIEPMHGCPDLIYAPTKDSWTSKAPTWARQRYDEIVNTLKSKRWNRELQWVFDNRIQVYEGKVPVVPGSIESTEGGKMLESENLFDSSRGLTHEQVHKLWERLCVRFADAASGKVRIQVSSVVQNSVFQAVELPVLRANAKVTLEFIN